jgi:hypothetical protein
MSERYSSRTFSRLAILALVLSVVGAAVGYFGFVSGIDYALSGSGHGPGSSIIIFFVGAALAIAAVVLAVLGLLRSHSKIVPVVALAVGLIPIAALIVIVLAFRR